MRGPRFDFVAAPCGDNWVGASFALPGVVEFPHCFYPEQ